MYYGGVIVPFYLSKDAFRSLRELGEAFGLLDYTCLVRAEFDGRFWHNFDDVQAVTYPIVSGSQRETLTETHQHTNCAYHQPAIALWWRSQVASKRS